MTLAERFDETVTRFCAFDGVAFETTRPETVYCTVECKRRAERGEVAEVSE